MEKMKEPLFSVLIANYNNGRYLMEAIESVFAQTYSNYEIVLVDDGSSDESKAIYEQLKDDKRIRIFYNEKNMGCAFTKHRCVQEAKGEICGYLDPDDVIMPNALQCSVEALLSHQDCVLTMSRHYVCDAALNIVEESRKLELQPEECYFEHHDYRAEVFACFSRKAYMQSGGLDVTLKRGVDADLYFRLEEQGKIAIVDEFTYKYRRHGGSLVANVNKMEYWNLIIRHNTCLRRGLPVEQYAERDFCDYVNSVQMLRVQQNEQALNSKAYKLGKMLLKPLSWFRK